MTLIVPIALEMCNNYKTKNECLTDKYSRCSKELELRFGLRDFVHNKRTLVWKYSTKVLVTFKRNKLNLELVVQLSVHGASTITDVFVYKYENQKEHLKDTKIVNVYTNTYT